MTMSALKRLQHKDWNVLRELWSEHLPLVELESEYPSPILQELDDIAKPELNAGGTGEVGYVLGLREAVFREALISSRKFVYCAKLLPILADSGRNTWAALGAYESSFYAAKSIVLLLGFAPLHKDSNVFVDAFYETKIKKGKQQVSSYEILRFHKLDERLTHAILWPLLRRLIETTTFEHSQLPIQEGLHLIEWEKFSKFRNAVFYNSAFWPKREEYPVCDLVRIVENEDMKRVSRLGGPGQGAPFAADYFKAASLLRQLLAGLIESLSKISRPLEVELKCLEEL